MMLKRFFTWGYLKFVFWPNVAQAMQDEGEIELEIDFVPDEDWLAEFESKGVTKH